MFIITELYLYKILFHTSISTCIAPFATKKTINIVPFTTKLMINFSPFNKKVIAFAITYNFYQSS